MVGIHAVGGFAESSNAWENVSPSYLNVFTSGDPLTATSVLSLFDSAREE